MKILRKIMPMLLSVMLLVAALPANADAKTYKEEAGSQVTVEIPVTKGFGGEGTVVFSDDSLFTAVEISGENVGSFQLYDNNIAFANNSEIKDGSIIVKVTISDSAKEGDSCKISVSGYEYVDADDNMVPSALESQTVVVAAEGSASQGGTDTEGGSDEGQSSVVDYTDYSELEECIALAESLDSTKYTADSWAKLMEALQLLYDARGCGDQAQVDAAVQAFRDAFAALVEMDYSKLIKAMEEANATIESDELASLISQLVNLLLEGEELLSSNDQAAVDAKADEILAIIEQIKALLGADDEVQEPMDTEPEGEYCNIPIHKVWPILFFISLAVNVVLIVLLVSRKKKPEEKAEDDTPMVDYQISDDDK